MWMEGKGVFEQLGLRNLVVAGTKEGPIVMLAVKNGELERVALLCGHSSPVTDVRELIEDAAFLSVSQDGMLCEWSSLDGSLITVLADLGICPGPLSIKPCPWSLTHVWVWSLGEGAYFIDLENKLCIRKLVFPGLLGISVLSRHTSRVVDASVLVAVCLGKIVICGCEQDGSPETDGTGECKEREIPFSMDCRIHACMNGVIKVHRKKWTVLKPVDGSEMLSGEIEDDENDGFVSNVIWDAKDVFVLGTYTCVFHIYQLKNEAKKTWVENVRVWRFSNGYLNAKFRFNHNVGIVFADNGKVCLLNGVESKKLEDGPDNSRLFATVSDPEYTMLERIGRTIIAHVNWMHNETLQTWELNSEISALVCKVEKKSDKVVRHIVAGHHDGSVTFILDGDKVARNEAVALSSRVIAIVSVPRIWEDDVSWMAIGSEGDCCVFERNRARNFFEATGFPITTIFHCPGDNVLCILYQNGSYVRYSLSRRQIIGVSCEAPPEATIIWTVTPQMIDTGVFEVSVLNFRTACIFFVYFQASKYHAEWENIGREKDIMHYLKREFISQSNTNRSFVILGEHSAPTIFDGQYHITEEVTRWASPTVSTLNFIQLELVREMVGASVKGECCPKIGRHVKTMLSILVRLITNETPAIQDLAMRICIREVGNLDAHGCRFVVAQHTNMVKRDLARYEMFLLSLVAANRPVAVGEPSRCKLAVFLLDVCNGTIPHNSARDDHVWDIFAAAILIQGFDEWSQREPWDVLVKTIVKTVLKNSRVTFLQQMFQHIVCQNLAQHLDMFSSMAKEMINAENYVGLRELVNIYNTVVHENTQVCGTRMTFILVLLYEEYPSLSSFFDEMLTIHAIGLDAVAVYDDIYIIGDDDGEIWAYKQGKLIFVERLLPKKVALVSIEPGGQHIAALSEGEESEGYAVVAKLRKMRQVEAGRGKKVELVPRTGKQKFSVTWTKDHDVQITVM